MEENTQAKPPKFIVIIFGAFLLLALFNIYSDLVSSNNIKPFGFLEPVMAVARDITGKSAPNSGSISYVFSSSENIIDQLDRCLVIDPNKADPPSKVYENKASNRLEQNFSGANQALTIDGGYDKSAFTKYYDRSSDFGMGFSIAISRSNDDATVNAAIEYINDALTYDLTPIIRLCDSVNDCPFNSVDSIVNFYNGIAAGTDGEFIAMLGPNEPGTGEGRSEMEGFGFARGDYGGLTSFVNSVAEQLQPLRDQGVILSPGAANMSNTRNNDVKGYISGLDPDLYDVIMGNSYEVLENEGTTLAYDYYEKGPNLQGDSSLKDFVDENDLQFIATEFGIFREAGRSESQMLANAKLSFEKYCGDANVAGVLFFFGIKDLSADTTFGKLHSIEDSELTDIIGDCERKKTRNPKVDLAWQSCNLDSCIYEDYQYPSNSYAQSCGVDPAEPIDELEDGAMLFIGCDGGGCSAKKRETVEVGLPLKQFGNNTSSGTRFNSYVPLCAELAELFSGDPLYDPLNQFAANLESNSGPDYPMPWLGSALNCATNLIKATGEFADDYSDTDIHPGSILDQTIEEFKLDLESGIYSDGTSSLAQIDPNKIPDERSVCKGNEQSCLDKNNNSNFIKDLRDYVPTQIPKRYYIPENNSCKEEEVVIERDNSNYVYGPEIYLGEEKTMWSGPTGQVCVWHAKRNTASAKEEYYADEDASNISCVVNVNGTVPRNINGVNVEIPCTSLGEVPGLINNLEGGQYILGDEYANCYNYSQKDEDRVYYYDNDYPEIPEYDIPGVYDALFNMYLRTQEKLEAQNIKLVVKDNVGWEMKVRTKVRDTNRGYDVSLVGNYDYGQELSSCSVSPDLFQNEYLMAKQNPIQEQSVYFEYLGYLDILQEIVNIYASQTSFEASSFATNPLLTDYSKDDLPTELKKDVVVESGRANFLMTFPIPTCDDIEKLKFLSAQNNRQPEDDDYFAPDFETTCFAAINDSAYSDDLGNFLCDQGYDIPGVCKAPEIDVGECRYVPDEENTEDEVLIDGDFKLIPPTRGGRISGRYGGAQYGTPGAIHTGMDFGDVLGNDLLASAGGTVIYVGPDNENTSGAYGQMIKIKHSNGYVTLYAHNSELLVSVGQVVEQGDVIGRVGSTGNSSGPHSHLELRKNDTCTWDGNSPGVCTVDPAPYMVGAVGGEQGQDPTDRGGTLVCEDTDGRVTDRKFNGLNCLIKEVSDYISAEEYSGIPPEMLRATIEVETGAQTERGNAQPPTGDPSQLTYNYENSATAMGSFQFTRSAWMDSPSVNIINRYNAEMLRCTKHLGLNVVNFTYGDRAVIGISACAAALKHIDDVKSDPGWGGLGVYVPADEWTEETARVAAYNYYGGCAWQYGNLSGNYCDDIAGIFNKYRESRLFENLDCSSNGSGSSDTDSSNNNISAPE